MVFLNNSKDLFKNIDKLQNEIVDIIYTYIPKSVTIFLTKKSYIEEHHLIRSFINKRNIEHYIRAMVRHDNDFVFNQLLVENLNRWLNMKRYYYKECIYGNYLNFIESYALDNESIKCRKILFIFLQEQGLNKNQHKKNTNKYIRWRT